MGLSLSSFLKSFWTNWTHCPQSLAGLGFQRFEENGHFWTKLDTSKNFLFNSSSLQGQNTLGLDYSL